MTLASATVLLVAGCVGGDGRTGPVEASDSARAGVDGVADDPEVVAALGSVFGDDVDRAAVAVVRGGDVRVAYVNADAETLFELGSLTKLLTGLLLADSIERGEVALDDRLGDFLDLGTSDAASVTLERLATHRAGMPSLPDQTTDADPFPDTEGALVAQAVTVEVPEDPDFAYDNVGPALLGHALAAAAGVPYEDLLRERALAPAGMDDAVLVVDHGDVPEGLDPGYTLAGLPVEPWTFGEYAPAGGLAGTLGDVVALARSVLTGPFAESAALDPVYEITTRIGVGYFWFIEERGPRTLTAHLGETGGYSSALAVDRSAGTASVVLWNAPGDAEEVAVRLLLLAD